MAIAQGISKKLAEEVVVAKLVYTEPIASLKACVAADIEDDEVEEADVEQSVLWDMTRPLEGSCRLELLKFEHPAAQDVFWHSSAHILGQAMERQYGCHLTIGPALKSGFYYDGFFGDKKLGAEDFKALEEQAAAICKEQQPFQRCVITKEEALELFSENPFKVQLITNKVPDGAMTSCYRCGPLIDLCRGPHLPNTGRAKAFMITRNSAAYWLGDQTLDTLQRVYGVAFPSDKLLKEYKRIQEEAAKRDHRKLGTQLELFMLHPTASPGCTFWYPAGARIYNKLIEFIRSEYSLRNFTEVITPNMYSSSLFMTSGHYQHYKDDMYSLDVEKQEWMLKPMNCPGHFLMFDSKVRSYKELPMRFADFGVLHRNEASGALSGLTRVRRFQQDDAHIFVRPEQIKNEVMSCLDFLSFVYKVFGFKASYALSTRPKKALGSKEIWDNAEGQLKAALNEFGTPWTLNAGDGAFYGPKIDIRLTDVLQREHQCGTIQLDFNNPIRFNLQYRKEGAEETTEEAGDDKQSDFKPAVETNAKGDVIWKEGRLKNGFERPVIIHRAILGSVERMSAILIEHFAGKWPFWLSPRQVMVVPVGEKFNSYALWVQRQFVLHGYFAEVDVSGKTLPKKVREAQVGQWNYIAVVGDSEMNSLSVNLRERSVEKPIGVLTMAEVMAKLGGESMPTSQPRGSFEPFEGRMPPEVTSSVAESAPLKETRDTTQSQVATPKEAAAPGKAGVRGKATTPKVAAKTDAGATSDAKSSSVGNGDVEAFLEKHPYVQGFVPSVADRELYNEMRNRGFPQSVNLCRWFKHVDSFTDLERSIW
eukprot:TRINITY_DN1561_c0_g2_i1.p1 TRINITY_DN1561_c0_g2~~TRINITY_DN1561_c0_g2_i1.p1  ORF type:complete len:927 (-),score=171.58 TRINITY_DN1561_c0_g2_i1:104-2557(-)